MWQGRKKVWWMGALVWASLAGCNGCEDVFLQGDDPPKEPPPAGECKPAETTCSDRESFRDGQCRNTYCDVDGECCPGTRCDTAIHLCRSRLNDDPCTEDLDCTVPGQKCSTQAGGVRVCAYEACGNTQPCAGGLNCVQGQCLASRPCAQGCAVGEVCDVPTNSCHPAVGRPGCDVTCETGEVPLLVDPITMRGDVCCAWECACAPLPPLLPGVLGLYASVVAGKEEVMVANHDSTYGDLVVSRYSREGDRLRVDYVDGFPAAGTVGGNPLGPRRGIVDVGDVVGEYAATAADPTGRVHVAYYDRTHGALKYAVQETDGQGWHHHTVDDTDDAGHWVSITIRPADGAPVISFTTLGRNGAGRNISRVRLAESTVASPRATAQWTLRTVEEALAFDACNQACTGAQVCVLADPAPRCAAPATTACSPSCGQAQACVLNGTAATCEGLADPGFEGMPRVVGQFTAVASYESRVVVAYHDAVHATLKASSLRGGVVDVPLVVDGDGLDGRHGPGVGQFVDMAMDLNGKVAMVYWNAADRDLVYYEGVNLRGGRFEVVDTGGGSPPGSEELGADATVRFGPDGTAYVAYQNQSSLDPYVAQREPSGLWTRWAVLGSAQGNGALGFFTTLAVSGSRAFVANVKAELDERRQLANKLGLQVETVPRP